MNSDGMYPDTPVYIVEMHGCDTFDGATFTAEYRVAAPTSEDAERMSREHLLGDVAGVHCVTDHIWRRGTVNIFEPRVLAERSVWQ